VRKVVHEKAGGSLSLATMEFSDPVPVEAAS
jgi:hypothetical protein